MRSSIANLQSQQRRGLNKGGERALVRMGKINTAIAIGTEDLSLWDMEELKRGQRRDKNGRWQGSPPKIVPKAIHDEMVKRTLSTAEQLLRDSLADAVEMLVEMIKSPGTDDKAKVKGIEMIMNRVMGKETQKVEISGKTKWEIALESGIVSVPVEDKVE